MVIRATRRWTVNAVNTGNWLWFSCKVLDKFALVFLWVRLF